MNNFTKRVLFGLERRGLLNFLPDKIFLKIMFNAYLDEKLNLSNPQTFNEKMQWIKLYDRNPEYTRLVDKVEVKNFVAEKIGEKHIIPTLGVWDNVDDIDFDSLPDQFVLKCNHNSGLGMCICKDKSKLDIQKVKNELSKGLKQDYFYHGREWPYKNVPHKVFAEKYIADESGYELKDYKFYCFDGKVRLLMINSDRMSDKQTRADYFDENFEHKDFFWGYNGADTPPSKPEMFEEMVSIAEKLSEGIPHVRVDLYQTPHGIYFGEITFFDGSGFDKIVPSEWDYRIGSWINIPV